VRLRSLDLEHFGHFRGQRLAFDGKAFALVHGHNEAGKTTVLEAIRWLLFGGTGARYAFDGETSQLAVGARVELASGSAIDIRRNNGKGKGLKGIGGSGDEIDEEWILTRLTRPNRAVFENVFGFSLAGLAKGADALEHADLKHSIFGGGLGGTVQPAAILDDLERQRSALFKEGGKNQPVHVRAKKIEALSKKVNELTTRAEDWNRLQTDLDQRRRAAKDALEHLRALGRTESLLRARLDAQAPLQRREAAAAELANLNVPEGIPEDAESRHAAACASLTALEREARELLAIIDDAQAVLAGELDESLLARDAEIATLAKGLERYVDATTERPRRASELNELERRVRDRLTSLRPKWDLDRLRGFHVDTAARANLDAAIVEGDALDARESSLRTAARELEDDLRANDVARAALPAQVDVAPLRAWLDTWNELAAQQTVLTATLAEIRRTERKRAAIVAKMQPSLEGAARDVKTPPEDVVSVFETERAELDEQRRRLVADRARIDGELAAVDETLRKVDPERRAPAENELAAARARRDGLLEELVSAIVSPRADVHAVVRSHDRAVRDADDVADRMRVHADAVQRRAEATLQRTRLTETRATLDVALAKLETHEAAYEARWNEAWARAGLVPRPPLAMRAWMAARDEVAALEETLAEATNRRDHIDASLSKWEERGRALLDRDAPADELRARARASIDADEHRVRELASLNLERVRAEPRLAAVCAELSACEQARAEWAERWPALLRDVGLERELSRAAARTLITGLIEARTELVHGEQPLREGIARLDDELARYRSRAAEVLGSEPSDVVVAVRALEARLVTAREAARARNEARIADATAQRKFERNVTETKALRTELEALRSAAGVADDESFREVLRDRARRRDLQRDMQGAEQTLEQLRGAEPEEEFLAAVRALDREGATHELATTESEIKSLGDRLRALDEDVGHAKAKLEVIDGRQDAADALAIVEAERATLRDEVERWSVLTLAETLLASAIKRFERDYQPALLARASTVFAAMTDGRYSAIRRNRDDLAVERADGRELKGDALSTGTREQLYLAIRLAYVEHYCGNAEPLPIVLDDVLVNFDDQRAKATLRALSEFSSVTQILLFTCHQSTIALAEAAGVAATTLQVPTA
jgi:uncharacterized protein YhaN